MSIKYINGDVNCNGKIFTKNLEVEDKLIGDFDIDFKGGLTTDKVETKELNVSGETETKTLSVSSNANIGGTLTTSGDIHTDGDLQVNGSINGDEIVENMSGYQISTSGINPDFEYKYIGVCKNGNKLTLVWAFILTTTTTSYSGAVLPPIKVPADVGDKIYPIGTFPGISSLAVALQDVTLHQYADGSTTGHMLFYKYDNWINANLYANLTSGVKYLGRIELTFLLSDNLIS